MTHEGPQPTSEVPEPAEQPGVVSSTPDRSPHRTAVFTIDDETDIPPHFRELYSRMKYSDRRAVEVLGKKLFDSLIGDEVLLSYLTQQVGLALSGSAYCEIPTAAAVMADTIALLAEGAGFSPTLFRIQKAGDLSVTHYGAMSLSERTAYMQHFAYWVHEAEVAAITGQYAVVIDDLHATGTHERHVDAMLQTLPVLGYQFAYLISFKPDLSIKKPHTEDIINHSKVKTVTDLIEIFEHSEVGQVVLNARTVKFILKAAEHDFQAYQRFVHSMPRHFLELLHRAATSKDDYASMPTMRRGFEYIDEVLK